MTLGHRVLKLKNSPQRSPKLFNSSLRRKTLLKNINSNIQIGAPSKANLKVVVRVRPENQRELNSNGYCAIDVVDENMMIFDPRHQESDFFYQGAKQKFRDLNKRQSKEQKFMFERIFDVGVQNDEVFEYTSKDLVETLMNGYNCSVFAYGATGSGKTYTMIGSASNPGIIFMTVMELYKKIAEVEESKVCEVGVSYLEVYNEMVRDLLSPGKPLSLHETSQNVQVTGLSFHKPKDASELLNILANGNKNRSQHPTDANAESSRSHAVFQVFLRQYDRADPKSNVCISKLSMIDLAGSERGSATGFKGTRFREGANINRSLLALGNCINSLADGKSHIPYRDSKLTRLLKDSIGGNCRSVMIAAVTKSSLSYEDTFNTLRYANRAKTIKMSLKKNLINVNQHVSQYMKVVEDLKNQVLNLKEQLKKREEQAETSVTGVSEEHKELYENTIRELQKNIELKDAKDECSRKENEVLSELLVLQNAIKSARREYLQMNTAERDLELKLYRQRQSVVKMNVFAFASTRLDKGISKSTRSIGLLEKKLEHIRGVKQSAFNRMRQCEERIFEYCQSCNQKFPSTSEDCLPEFLGKKLDEYEVENTYRDSHQIRAYLQGVVEGLVSDHSKDVKLMLVLMHAVKEFYLKLRMSSVCDKTCADLMENIYAMLDESHIEWADLKNTDDSFREKLASEYVAHEPVIESSRLVDFPCGSSSVSPLVNDIGHMFRKSNLRKPGGGSTLVDTPTSSKCSPSERVCNTGALNLMTIPENESEESDFGAITSLEDIENDHISNTLKYSTRDSILVHRTSKKLSPVIDCGAEVDNGDVNSTITVLPAEEVSSLNSRGSCTEGLLFDQSIESRLDPRLLPNKESSNAAVQSRLYPPSLPLATSKESVDPRLTAESRLTIPLSSTINSRLPLATVSCQNSMEGSNVDSDTVNPHVHSLPSPINTGSTTTRSIPDLNCTVTLVPKSVSPGDQCNESRVVFECEESPKPLYSNKESAIIGMQSPSQSLPSRTSNLSLKSDAAPSISVSLITSPSTAALDLPSTGNETFCVVPEPAEYDSNREPSGVPLPSGVPSGKENVMHGHSLFTKKNGRLFLPAKSSLNKLTGSASKFRAGLKRTVSGSSLPNAQPRFAQKDHSLKKSTSFIRTPFGLANKHEDAPKTVVAFGSAFTNAPKPVSSKRHLSFRSPINNQ